MNSINNIDYGELFFSKRHALDKEAYAKYYDNNYPRVQTFNSWYGSESHRRYIIPLLRKYKLEKIKKLVIINTY
jgi:hypothetical protein